MAGLNYETDNSSGWRWINMTGRCCMMTTLMVTATSVAYAAEPAGTSAWRSFQNAGKVTIGDAAIPQKWSSESVTWQAKLTGYGQSSPIVDGDQIVVTSTSGDNKDNCHLTAYSLADGKQLWQQDFQNPSPEKNTSYVSRAAPTPIADEEGYVAFYEGGLVVAVTSDGQQRWKRDLVADYGAISARHGLSSSLEQAADRVFVWVERGEAPYLLALDKKTGKTIWKSEGLGATTWSTPRLIPTAHGSHLVCSASGKLAGFDPDSGKKLWEFTGISNNTSCTPVPAGEGRFLIGASDGRGAENSGKGAASNGVIQITKQDDGKFTADFLWHAKKASSSFGSPVAVGDRAFIVNRTGVLFQLDLETGEEVAASRLNCGGIWATPFAVGNRLYVFGYKGTTSVVSLPDGEELTQNRLWEESPPSTTSSGRPSSGGGHTLYAAAPAAPWLILRRGDTLYAVKDSTGSEQ